MSRYRCPSCRDAIKSERFFDGRLLFLCGKCSMGATLPAKGDIDESYLDFLDLYDKGKVKEMRMEELPEKERAIRSVEEIESLLGSNGSRCLSRHSWWFWKKKSVKNVVELGRLCIEEGLKKNHVRNVGHRSLFGPYCSLDNSWLIR